MENKPNKKVGGPDCTVKVYESLFTKHKNNCDRVLPFLIKLLKTLQMIAQFIPTVGKVTKRIE